MSDLVQGLSQALNKQAWIDRIGKPLQNAILSIYKKGGETGQKAADFMHGTWLGHPLHPVLTDVPIGAWTAAVALDMLDAANGESSPGLSTAADTAVGIGVAGAVGAAVTGFTDWTHLTGESRRTGFVHAALNVASLGFFIGSLVARGGRNRSAGRTYALIGYTIAGISAYLGGDMVYRQKIGVDHSPNEDYVDDFIPVIPLGQLEENRLTLAHAGETPLVLLRQGEKVFALANTCSHLGGPLAEGELSLAEEDCPAVSCPWHGSRFNLANGEILNGPTTYPQPVFETRVVAGHVEVRRRKES
jgi:nitrite reductase/ring-hydroxylating ferredoxin subunit/uncharacterized membrane protein